MVQLALGDDRWDAPKLNLGCARFLADGWINADVRQYDGAQCFDARSIPYPDCTFARVYVGHVLEHLPEEDVPAAVSEIHRVLAVGGKVMFAGPCLDRALQYRPGDLELQDAIIRGHAGWDEQEAHPLPGDGHHWICTLGKMLGLIRPFFPAAAEVPDADVPRTWPVVSRGHAWQVFVGATK